MRVDMPLGQTLSKKQGSQCQCHLDNEEINRIVRVAAPDQRGFIVS